MIITKLIVFAALFCLCSRMSAPLLLNMTDLFYTTGPLFSTI